MSSASAGSSSSSAEMADRLAALQQVAPQLGWRARAGKPACHAYDGDPIVRVVVLRVGHSSTQLCSFMRCFAMAARCFDARSAASSAWRDSLLGARSRRPVSAASVRIVGCSRSLTIGRRTPKASLDESVHAQEQERLTAGVEEVVVDPDVRFCPTARSRSRPACAPSLPLGRTGEVVCDRKARAAARGGRGLASPFGRHLRQDVGDRRGWPASCPMRQHRGQIARYGLDRVAVDPDLQL